MTPASEGSTPGSTPVDDLPTVSGPVDPIAPPVTPPPTTGGGSTTGEAADQGKQVASHASDQAKSVASEASDHSRQVASEAADASRQVVQTAKEQVADLRTEVTSQARTVFEQSTAQLSEQAQAQTEKAGQALRTLSEQTAALAEGRTDEAGELGRYVQQVSDQLDQLSQRIESGGFTGMLDDVQRFARRRPGAFLLGAAALGVVAGRVGRGAKEASSDGGSQAALPAPTPPTATPRPAATTMPTAAAFDEPLVPTGAADPGEDPLAGPQGPLP